MPEKDTVGSQILQFAAAKRKPTTLSFVLVKPSFANIPFYEVNAKPLTDKNDNCYE